MADQHKRGGHQVEYAKSGRAACKGCGSVIKQDSMRIGKETKSEYHDGWDVSWYHMKCAPRANTVTDIKDWELLRWKDQITLKKDFTKEAITDTEEDRKVQAENEKLWAMKDLIDEHVPNKFLKSILEANGMEVTKVTPSRLIHKVADGMLYGYIGKCPDCGSEGTLRATGRDYICKGWMPGGFTRCEFRGIEGVERYKWKIPADLKKSNKWLSTWKYPEDHPTLTREAAQKGEKEGVKEEKKEEEEEEEKDDGTPEEEVPEKLELYGMKIAVAGTKKDLGMTQDEVEELIEEHGGEYQDDIYTDTSVLIATPAELSKKKKTKKITTTLKQKRPILSIDWLTNLCNRTEQGIKLRKNEEAKAYLIEGAEMGEDPIARKYSKAKYEKELKKEEDDAKMEIETVKKETAAKKKKPEPKEGSDILKVDPKLKTELGGDLKVLVDYNDEDGYIVYHSMLNVSDITTGVNKYYQMQVCTKGKTYYFSISYGRVGTSVGDHKSYKHGSKANAIAAFEDKFLEKSGNKWENRHSFQKKGGLYFMIDLDDGHEDNEAEEEIKAVKKQRTTEDQLKKEEKKDAKPEGAKVLPRRTQELVSTIFDKEMMKQTLQAMEVDIKKMPLGKIKKSQIKDGYKVLTEIQDILTDLEIKDRQKKQKLQDCANRFYTLLPHDFGHNSPPLIDNLEAVKKKMDLLDALVDIEIASSLMDSADSVSETDPVYKNYQAIKAFINPVEKSSDIYKKLEAYAYNSHDKKYFTTFDFDVIDIFEIDREGEQGRFDPWAKNENRVLLWHGSRLTNWVGIISQGLRIAPPEAPKSGYRFGKGVYFADCISKSGSYCCTSNTSPYAVMLLAEVALGKPNELTKDQYMEKAPSGTHCTKALGMAAPDPKDDDWIPEKIKVPVGKIKDTGLRTACTHNEYIIYDVAQVKIRYLLKLKFNHKSAW